MAKKTNSNAATEETTKTVEVSAEQKLRAVNSRQREKIKTLEAYGKKMKLQLLDCRSENISNCFELQQQLNSAHEIEMKSSKDFFTILIISVALLTFIAGITLGIAIS